MEVILLEKVENLGSLGDRVHVKPGYGRNFLIPSGKATPATEEHIKAFEARRAELEKAAAEALAEAEARRDRLEDMTVTVRAKAGEEGKLFGSVGTADIAEAISETSAILFFKTDISATSFSISLLFPNNIFTPFLIYEHLNLLKQNT